MDFTELGDVSKLLLGGVGADDLKAIGQVCNGFRNHVWAMLSEMTAKLRCSAQSVVQVLIGK